MHMTAKVEIKAATAADQAALAQIYLIDRQQDFPWVVSPQLKDFEHDSRGEFVLVAWVNGQRAGFCSLYRLANFIHLLFVAPDFRHLKVGESLFCHTSYPTKISRLSKSLRLDIKVTVHSVTVWQLPVRKMDFAPSIAGHL